MLSPRRLRYLPAPCGPGFSSVEIHANEHWRNLYKPVRCTHAVVLPEFLKWLEVELEREGDGRLIYKVETLGIQGQLVEIKSNVGSGELIGME